MGGVRMKQLLRLVVSASVLGALLLVACGEREEPAKVEQAPSAQEVTEKAKEAVEETAAVQKQREEYEQRIEAKLEEYGEKLADLHSKAEGLEQQARADFDQKIQALQEKQQLALEKLAELKSAGSEAWEDMKSGVSAAMEDLDQTYQSVLSSLELPDIAESAGEAVSESAGKIAGEVAGKSVGESAAEIADEVAGEAAREVVGEVAGESAGKALVEAPGETAEVSEVITLKATLWEEHSKSAVTLTHKKHATEYGVACSECHHKYEDGKNVWKEGDPVQKCQECHTDPTIKGEKQLPPAQQKLNLKLAFHNNCQGCHRKLKMQDREKYADIPTTCAQCHPLEKE
jgi:hypothetical protein